MGLIVIGPGAWRVQRWESASRESGTYPMPVIPAKAGTYPHCRHPPIPPSPHHHTSPKSQLRLERIIRKCVSSGSADIPNASMYNRSISSIRSGA